MLRIPRFAQRSLHSLSRRAGVAWRRHGLNRFVRNKTVRLIDLNGRRYKRVTLPDSFVASSVTVFLKVLAYTIRTDASPFWT